MEKETMQVFEKEQQTSENKVDDLEKEITQGELEERGQSENDSGTVPEEPSPSSPEEENAPSQKRSSGEDDSDGSEAGFSGGEV